MPSLGYLTWYPRPLNFCPTFLPPLSIFDALGFPMSLQMWVHFPSPGTLPQFLEHCLSCLLTSQLSHLSSAPFLLVA